MNNHTLLAEYGHVLTPNEHQTFELHRIKNMSQRAIALHLRISRSAVQSRLENAERKLHHAQQEAA